MKTRRQRRTKTIESKIEQARIKLEKAEACRDRAAKDLKTLMDRRDEIRKRELMDAICKSRRSYEEILNFIRA